MRLRNAGPSDLPHDENPVARSGSFVICSSYAPTARAEPYRRLEPRPYHENVVFLSGP